MQKRNLKSPLIIKKMLSMYQDANYTMFGKGNSGKNYTGLYFQMPYLPPFCGNKTLKHFYWNFQHKPMSSNNWVTGTIYYKIWYKVYSVFTSTWDTAKELITLPSPLTEIRKRYLTSLKILAAIRVHIK